MFNKPSLFCCFKASTVLLAASGACALAQAQGAVQTPPSVSEATGAATRFTISGFDVTGANPFSSEASQQLLSPFITADGNLAILQKATETFETALRDGGYPLHRVSLPPQELGGRVRLVVVKFVIGNISVEGQKFFTQENILASLPELRAGEAPNFSTLAVQTAIGNENPSRQLQVSLKESTEPDKIDVKLLVKDARPWNLLLNLANTGTDATGQDRLAVVGSHVNLFGLDHQFSGAYTTSIERSSDVQQLGLNYRVPLYAQGGVLGVSYTRSDVVGNFGSFTSTGAGQTYGINYYHYFAPVGGRRSYLSVALDEKIFDSSQPNNNPLALGQPEKISSRPLSVGYSARVESDDALWGYNAELVFNLPGGSGNSLTDYQNATSGSLTPDLRLTTAKWKALRGGGNYFAPLASGWRWGWRGQFQFSPDALIAGEQFGIGGTGSVRGTSERPLSGDSGVFSSLEVATPELRPGLRAIGFVDAGWLKNHRSELSANKPASDQLVSVGLGLRYAMGNYGFSAEWGRVVKGSVLPSAPESGIPETGDEKIHINLNLRF
jgi:hemolysin activation/secretion protein